MNDIRRFIDILTEDAQGESHVLAMLKMQGFDVEEELYHGTDKQFDKFDRRFARTADDIYTSPDQMTASNYGKHLYVVIGRQQPQADLMEDWQLIDQLSTTFADYFKDAVEADETLNQVKTEVAEQLLAKARQEGNDDYDDWEAAQDAEDDPRYLAALLVAEKEYCRELLTSSKIYDYDMRGRFQDEVMHECFGLGYKSVRFYDHSSYGESESIVFHSPDDLFILRQEK